MVDLCMAGLTLWLTRPISAIKDINKALIHLIMGDGTLVSPTLLNSHHAAG